MEFSFKENSEQYITGKNSILLSIIAVLIFSYIFKLQWTRIRFSKKYGCKSAKIFPDGKFLSIRLALTQLKMKREGLMLEDVANHFENNNASTLMLRFIGVPIFMTREPENIKAMLATQFNDFSLGIRHAQFKPLLGDGIFTLDGEGWKNSRAMLRPQFAREQISHVKSIEPHFKTFSEHIRNAKGGRFDIQELFFRLTIDTATEFLFGESVYSLRDGTVSDVAPIEFEERNSFPSAFNTGQSYLATRSYVSFMYFLINNYEFRDSVKKVHKFTQHFVQKVLNYSESELEEQSKGSYIFLYELAKHTKNPKVLQDQLLNILLAGRDTTAGLLSFTMYELARNPDIYEKLKQEIYATFGHGGQSRIEEISFESLKKCEYLKFVINEALRMYPSVPINFRVSVKDTTLPLGGGMDEKSPIFVPKGTTVAYSVHCTHRMEKYYGKDAHVFRPERWKDMNKLGWAYVPFNGGPRICLGQQFALTEASYIITRIVQSFPNLSSEDVRSYPPRKNVQLTSCLHDGCWITLN